ncbi:MAG: ABC transporter permease [Defluviitaleaceae bacterium]|nr:ABC transporter permease [Defluviitaleaceae bacterium]
MVSIFKKEIRAYFTQMTGYLFLMFMILLTGIYFALYCVYAQSPQYQAVLSGVTIVFFIMIPTLTMRLFAEEVRHKTDQLLYTSPLSVGKIVIGKFLAATALFLFGLLITGLFPLLLSRYGSLPTGQIMGAFFGFFLLGASFIAVGLFISVLTDNQIISAVATFAVLFVFFMMDFIAISMPATTLASLVFLALIILGVAFVMYNSTKNVFAAAAVALVGFLAAGGIYLYNNLIFDGFIIKTLQWFSLYSRYGYFVNGIMNTSDVVYYVTFALVFIYLTVNVIEKRRWR